jgi:hypothetical protein
MFSSWGLRVEGADISEEMIVFCRMHFPQTGIRWAVRSFTQPDTERFDVVVCAGNSLALAGERETAMQAIDAMAQSASAAVVLQVVNLYARPEGPVVWDKCRRMRLSIGECILNKGIHRCGNEGYVDVVLTPLSTAEPKAVGRSIRFLGFGPEDLVARLRANGFAAVECFGNYARDAFALDRSGDLIVVAFR